MVEKHSAVNENGEELYPTKWNYEFADIPVIEHQHTRMFTGEEVTKIIAKAEGQVRIMFVLFAASGLRVGELFGLEVKHFNGNAITVEQSVWEGRVQTPKTRSAFRQVDLHPTVAAMLRDFIGARKEGFIFRTRTGTPSSSRTPSVASCTRFLKNWESRNRAFTASGVFASRILNQATCRPLS